jgi:hypothetical protein
MQQQLKAATATNSFDTKRVIFSLPNSTHLPGWLADKISQVYTAPPPAATSIALPSTESQQAA